MKIIVTGSSGFIGGHLVRILKSEGHFVVGVDIEEPMYESPSLFMNRDLRIESQCREVFSHWMLKDGIDEVYNLACLMGGMGFIGDPSHNYDVMIGSSQIVANVISCSKAHSVKKSFYSSSACVYNQTFQGNTNNPSLSEDMAYPAFPDLVYGWQKLFSEQMYQASGLNVRIARFHNIYGPEGTYKGGKEKAPAAMCQKAYSAWRMGDSDITIWGDGEQTRSFLYIDDCIDAVRILMESDHKEPINIGSEEMVTINQLATIAMGWMGEILTISHIDGPTGVRGRNSDNTRIRAVLGWEPKIKLNDGMARLYKWIAEQNERLV